MILCLGVIFAFSFSCFASFIIQTFVLKNAATYFNSMVQWLLFFLRFCFLIYQLCLIPWLLCNCSFQHSFCVPLLHPVFSSVVFSDTPLFKLWSLIFKLSFMKVLVTSLRSGYVILGNDWSVPSPPLLGKVVPTQRTQNEANYLDNFR